MSPLCPPHVWVGLLHSQEKNAKNTYNKTRRPQNMTALVVCLLLREDSKALPMTQSLTKSTTPTLSGASTVCKVSVALGPKAKEGSFPKTRKQHCCQTKTATLFRSMFLQFPEGGAALLWAGEAAIELPGHSSGVFPGLMDTCWPTLIVLISMGCLMMSQ